MPRGPDGRTVLADPESLNGWNGPVGGRNGIYRLSYRIPTRSRRSTADKALKTKGSFPSEDAARKLVYLALQNAVPQWTRTRNWTAALLAFKIHFGERVPDSAG